IEIPRFRYGPKDQGGVGQGKGDPGEALNGQEGEGRGEAGDSPGQHLIEVDVSLEELADILGEELELPRIQPKGNKTIETVQTRYTGRAPVGPNCLRLFKSSYKQALRRLMAEGKYDPKKPIVVPVKEDLRYRTFKKVTRPQANAVVIYM